MIAAASDMATAGYAPILVTVEQVVEESANVQTCRVPIRSYQSSSPEKPSEAGLSRSNDFPVERGDPGLVMSAMTNFDSPASSLTVSVKSFVSGLSKLKTIGT